MALREKRCPKLSVVKCRDPRDSWLTTTRLEGGDARSPMARAKEVRVHHDSSYYLLLLLLPRQFSVEGGALKRGWGRRVGVGC